MNTALKVLLTMSMVGTLVSTAFAEVSIGAWGRGIFSPVTTNDKKDEIDPVPNNGVSWGGQSARIGMTIRGNSDNVGFHVDMNTDFQTLGFQDQQKIWVKPFEILTLEVGPSIFYDALRGDAAFGVWNYMRFAGQDDEDLIFARGKAGMGDQWLLRQNSTALQGGWGKDGVFGGALLHVDVKGFHAFTSLDQSKGSTDAVAEKYTTAIMLKRGQYGMGYDIPKLGLARAQYIGKAYLPKAGTSELRNAVQDNEYTNYGIIQLAIRMDKLVENLYVDLGSSFATVEQAKTGDARGYTSFAGYVKYGFENVTLHAMTQAKLKMLAKDKKNDLNLSESTGIHSGIGADIKAGGVTINTDIRFFNKYWINHPEAKHSFGFLAGVSKGFSNGRIAAGLEFITESKINAALSETENPGKNMFALPIIVEYWF